MPASPIPVGPDTSGTPGTFRGDACPGALKLHAADDGYLARIRVPGGVLDADQARALGDAARRLGDGALHLTSRGNVQVRGVREGCGGELAELLGAAGLLPSAAHERVRNVVASPMSGLDGLGFVDVRAWLTGLDAAVLASSVTPALSGRFLFALDDGRGDVAGLGPDVLLRGCPDGSAVLSVGGAEFALRYEDAARAAVVAAEVFVGAAGGVSGRRVWRVRELGMPAPELAALIAARLQASGIESSPDRAATGIESSPLRGAGRSASSIDCSPDRGAGNCALSHDGAAPADQCATGNGAQATGLRPGPRSSIAGGADFYELPPGTATADFHEPSARTAAADFHEPSARTATARQAEPPVGPPRAPVLTATPHLGTVPATQWTALTTVIATLPARELRLTPWRRIVLPGAGPAQAAVLARAGLDVDPGSPRTRVGACIGRPGCAKAHADVRADATARHPRLPTYWSGCERRCGHPAGPYVDVVARPDGTYAITEPPTSSPS